MPSAVTAVSPFSAPQWSDAVNSWGLVGAMAFKSEFLQILEERGFINQVTDGIDEAFCKGPVTAYIGFDCTSDSLHIGSLIPIMVLRWLQKCGHRPIALAGGGTTRVGDPSGRDESRKLLTEDQIQENVRGILQNYEQFIDFSDGKALLVNNDDWLKELNYIEFLREVGTHFSVNRMLTMESVKVRLEREQSLSFIELNYMVMQGYDFVELHRRHGCTVQMGGSDQWGNIISGVELGRRMLGLELYGLTTPLLLTSEGKKMGKTADGAVWLSAHRLPPYDYYQYWRNVADADVEKLLGLFTELPMPEVRRLGALPGEGINEAKKVLAYEVTRLTHGKDAADAAAETARATFESGALGADLPVTPFSEEDKSVTAAMIRLGFSESKSEAKRLIKSGAVKVNDGRVDDEFADLDTAQAADGKIKISVGKKRHGIVQVS